MMPHFRTEFFAVRFITAFMCLILVIGCGEEHTVGSTGSEGDRLQSAVIAPKAELSTEYLVGQWCLRSVGLMDTGEKPNVDWRFQRDGSLTYQTSANLPSHDDGSWKLEDGELVLDARPIWGPVLISEISADVLVINQTLDYRLERGACT